MRQIVPPKPARDVIARHKRLLKLFELARVGNAEAIRKLRLEYQCKFYTQQEVRLAERLVKWRQNMSTDNEVVYVRDKELVIDLQPLYQSEQVVVAQINWLQQMEDSNYFVAGVTYLTGPGAGGCSEWMLKQDKTQGFVPMFCTLGFNSNSSIAKGGDQSE